MSVGLRERALQGIDRYRASRWRAEQHTRCRFTPTCSHYAEDALRQRSFPAALLLVVWRLLRCTSRTPMGTYDPVPRRGRPVRTALAVLSLSALTALMVSWTASAVAAPLPGAAGPIMAGGCEGFVGGVPVGNLDSDHALQVHKGQRLVITGRAPASIPRTASLQLDAVTTAQVHFIENVASTTTTGEKSTGQQFQKVVNVDKYLKYGSGVYRVDVQSVAPGAWNCTGTFYVELNGSKIAVEIAVAAGAVGALGVAGAAGGKEPDPASIPRADDQGMYDPAVSPDVVDRANLVKDRPANAAASGGTACLAGILFALIASTGAFAAAAPPPKATAKRVWVKGHTVLGFLSGLLAGVGAAVAGQQLGWYPLTVYSAIVLPLAFAVLGGIRARIGRAWKLA